MEIFKTYPLITTINGWIIDNIFKLKNFSSSGLRMMEDTSQSELLTTIDNTQNNELPIYNVKNNPVMIEAINVISVFGKSNKVIIRAKGDDIPNAVAIANIVTEKMLKGTSKIQKIMLDTELPAGIGKMLSTIEIVLQKN